MFDNIGDKIKALAKVLTIFGIVISVIYGMGLMVMNLFFVGILVMVLGSLLVWIGSFTLYGFGELINQSKFANSNSKKIYDLLNKKEHILTNSISQQVERTKEPQKPEHKWLCDSCGKLRNESPCPYCGNE